VAAPKKKPIDETYLRSLARGYTEQGVRVLGGFVTGEGIEPEIQVQAIKILFDRGWGRPVSKTEVTGANGANEITVVLRTIVEGRK
jgi:hypothetical protein